MLLRQPADLLLGPTLVRDTIPGHILVMIAAVAAVAGIARQAREHGLRPIHASLAFYTTGRPSLELSFREPIPFAFLAAGSCWRLDRGETGSKADQIGRRKFRNSPTKVNWPRDGLCCGCPGVCGR